MVGEFDIYGVYFPAFAVIAAITSVFSLRLSSFWMVRNLSLRLASRAVRPGGLCDFAWRRHGGSREFFTNCVRVLMRKSVVQR